MGTGTCDCRHGASFRDCPFAFPVAYHVKASSDQSPIFPSFFQPRTPEESPLRSAFVEKTADFGPRLRHRGPRSEHARARRALAWASPSPSEAVHLFEAPHSHESAPQTAEPDGATADSGPRLRRRGPRSEHARSRRTLPWASRSEPVHFPQPSTYCIWYLNCQGLKSHLAEISARIHLAPAKPSLLCLNETFLDKAILDLATPSYDLVVRRDRNDGRQCGGVAVYALTSVAPSVTVCGISPVAERVSGFGFTLIMILFSSVAGTAPRSQGTLRLSRPSVPNSGNTPLRLWAASLLATSIVITYGGFAIQAATPPRAPRCTPHASNSGSFNEFALRLVRVTCWMWFCPTSTPWHAAFSRQWLTTVLWKSLSSSPSRIVSNQGALCEILRRRIGETLPSQLRCNIFHSLTPAVRAKAPNV